MFGIKRIWQLIQNKLRRSIVHTLIFCSGFGTILILLIQSGIEADISLFRHNDAFATTKDGLVLANVPISKLLDRGNDTATPIQIDDIDKACSGGARIRPQLNQIQFSNEFWQVTTIKLIKSYLNGAYIDTRENVPYVRILFLSELFVKVSANTVSKMYCRFWISINNETRSTLVQAVKLNYLWYKEWGQWGSWHPYMLTCNIPPLPRSANTYWESVSIVWGKCSKSDNDLRLSYQVPADGRKTFGVCVKGLSFPMWDISRDLVEWIEMLKLLGVEGIHFHVFKVHPNVAKVMKYYEDHEFVTTKPVTLAGNTRHGVSSDEFLKNNFAQAWKQELITYNDCYLSNIYNYQYIAVLDVDEIIVPKISANWNDLIQDIYDGDAPSWEHAPSFCFVMRLFVNSIEDGTRSQATRKVSVQDTRGMANVKRPSMMTRLHWVKPDVYMAIGYQNYKCIHSVKSALAIHNHSPRLCLPAPNGNIVKECATYIQPMLGYTHHHRKSCCEFARFEDTADPQKLFHLDKSILRYSKELQSKSEIVMELVFKKVDIDIGELVENQNIDTGEVGV